MIETYQIAINKYEFGIPSSPNVLIQMVDDHDLFGIENEVDQIQKLAGNDFLLIALKVDDWNRDLSPWQAPAVFGNESFSGKAAETLGKVLAETSESKKYYIGGYSLSGLFALWAAYQTDVFSGVAAASPSIWFPGFLEYMEAHLPKTGKVYLSLGDREEKVKNPVMSTVGDSIRSAYDLLQKQRIPSVLEWNQGNHFRDPDIRTAKAFAWLLQPCCRQCGSENISCGKEKRSGQNEK